MSRKRQFTPDFGTAVRDIDASYKPDELRNPVPWPFIAIAFVLAAWGGATIYLDDRSTGIGQATQVARRALENGNIPAQASNTEAADAKVDDATAQGAALFNSYCATCHQANGAGVRGAIPPLDGSRYVLADHEATVAIVLRGISGPIEVAGQVYSGRMPTFHPVLHDEAIALILTHVRGSWSNNASPVEPSAVAAVRGALADGLDRPWQGGAELEEAFGIPTVVDETVGAAVISDARDRMQEDPGSLGEPSETVGASKQRAGTTQDRTPGDRGENGSTSENTKIDPEPTR